MRSEHELISNDQDEVTQESEKEGSKSLFGMVALDNVATSMIETGRVANLYTVFSHHGLQRDQDGHPIHNLEYTIDGDKVRMRGVLTV